MIRFRMNKITTEQFATLEDVLPTGNISAGFEFNVKNAVEARLIGIGAKFSFSSKDEIFMILKIFCEFEINPDDWNKCIENDVLTIPKSTMDYLLSQTVGVSRGILHCKTEGTTFNNIILPPLNVSGVIKGDVKFNMKGETG